MSVYGHVIRNLFTHLDLYIALHWRRLRSLRSLLASNTVGLKNTKMIRACMKETAWAGLSAWTKSAFQSESSWFICQPNTGGWSPSLDFIGSSSHILLRQQSNHAKTTSFTYNADGSNPLYLYLNQISLQDDPQTS